MATLTTRTLDAVASAMEVRLRSAQWAGGAAFHEVRRFVADDLIQAFRELVAVQDRVCIVAATGVDWNAEHDQPLLYAQRTARFTLLCSDQVLGDATTAIWGGEKNPGAWHLAELATAAVCGLLFPNPSGVLVRPAEQTPMSVVDLQRKLPGRAVVAVEVEAVGGTLVEVIRSYGPIA